MTTTTPVTDVVAEHCENASDDDSSMHGGEGLIDVNELWFNSDESDDEAGDEDEDKELDEFLESDEVLAEKLDEGAQQLKRDRDDAEKNSASEKKSTSTPNEADDDNGDDAKLSFVPRLKSTATKISTRRNDNDSDVADPVAGKIRIDLDKISIRRNDDSTESIAPKKRIVVKLEAPSSNSSVRTSVSSPKHRQNRRRKYPDVRTRRRSCVFSTTETETYANNHDIWTPNDERRTTSVRDADDWDRSIRRRGDFDSTARKRLRCSADSFEENNLNVERRSSPPSKKRRTKVEPKTTGALRCIECRQRYDPRTVTCKDTDERGTCSAECAQSYVVRRCTQSTCITCGRTHTLEQLLVGRYGSGSFGIHRVKRTMTEINSHRSQCEDCKRAYGAETPMTVAIRQQYQQYNKMLQRYYGAYGQQAINAIPSAAYGAVPTEYR